MSGNYLDCGCYIDANGNRHLCPTCADGSIIGNTQPPCPDCAEMSKQRDHYREECERLRSEIKRIESFREHRAELKLIVADRDREKARADAAEAGAAEVRDGIRYHLDYGQETSAEDILVSRECLKHWWTLLPAKTKGEGK